MGCNDTYLSGREVLNLTEHKKRDDSYVKFWSSIFVLPGNVSGFHQVSNFSYFFTTVGGLSGAGFKPGSGRMVLPYLGYLRMYMYAPRDIAILAILVSNRVCLLHSSLELGIFFYEKLLFHHYR